MPGSLIAFVREGTLVSGMASPRPVMGQGAGVSSIGCHCAPSQRFAGQRISCPSGLPLS